MGRKVKKYTRKIIVLGLIFCAVVAAVLLLNQKEEKETVYASMEEASLPVVYMGFGDSLINCLHGYTSSMDAAYMRDSITPLPDNRELYLEIEGYNADILSIGYEVRSVDGSVLYEKQVCSDWTKEENRYRLTVKLQDLLEKETEYLFKVNVMTSRYREISYYTRIRYYDDTNIGQMVDYARSFSDRIMAKVIDDEMKLQFESDSTGDNTSFGYTNIHSSYRHITWGDLTPQRVSDVQVTIKDMNAMVGSVLFEYKISIPGENDTQEYYMVNEYYCIRFVNNQLYLIAYERTASQEFTPGSERVKDGRIELGILNEEKLPVEMISSGKYTVFSTDGELWCYDVGKNEAVRLFSFYQEGDDGIRTGFDEHGYKIINVDENGNVDFTVFGYMNRGKHEGECGLAFYRYAKEENALHEIFYIPSSRPYQVLKEEVGMLSYIGENDLFYLMFGNSIYAIDFVGTEFVEIVGGLLENSFVIDEENGAVAWQEGNDIYAEKSIRVFNLNDGSGYTVTAKEGEYIRALGFIDGDFICGMAKESDVETDNGLTVNYPMYAMEIINKNQEVETRYEQSGIYISGISVDEGRILIDREVRTEGNSWVQTSQDALIQNWVEEKEEDSVLATEISSEKKKIYVINLEKTGSQEPLLVTDTRMAVSEEENKLSLASVSESKKDSRYYAYACGRLQGICYEAGEAISLIYDDMGVVVDGSQRYIWTRANRSSSKGIALVSARIAQTDAERIAVCLDTVLRQEGINMDVKAALEKGKSPYQILNDALPGGALDLSGCYLNQILYYVNAGCPVLVMTEPTKAELITGYVDRNSITLYDSLSGKTYDLAWDTAEAYFSAYGNNFVGYIR